MTTVQCFYDAIDTLAPFSTQADFDNSGLLVGSMQKPAQRALVTLDCSTAVTEEAITLDCQLIVSHHPLIFDPLRTLALENPVYLLAKHDIALISTHTPWDKAPLGINHVLYELLRTPLGLHDEPDVLEDGFGMVCVAETGLTPDTMANILRQALSCGVVRFSAGERPIRRIGFACGAGGSMLEEAYQAGCDAFITGDVKHDRWYYAKSRDISLFDCGHYALEQPSMPVLRDLLAKLLPGCEVLYAQSDIAPACYCV